MFRDRVTAGDALARRLDHLRGTDAIVLALPRGGVPIGARIAEALGLPLDLVLVRKVGLPGQPELALAAIAGPEGRTVVVNREVAGASGETDARIEALAAPERAELARRRRLWMADREPPELTGRVAILVDDGIATGATIRAAARAVRAMGATRLVIAVPVAPPEEIARLREEADEVICLEEPVPFRAVGLHYQSFPQVSDTEVRRLLDAARAAPAGDGALPSGRD